jgi:hypothetical protein
VDASVFARCCRMSVRGDVWQRKKKIIIRGKNASRTIRPTNGTMARGRMWKVSRDSPNQAIPRRASSSASTFVLVSAITEPPKMGVKLSKLQEQLLAAVYAKDVPGLNQLYEKNKSKVAFPVLAVAQLHARSTRRTSTDFSTWLGYSEKPGFNLPIGCHSPWWKANCQPFTGARS